MNIDSQILEHLYFHKNDGKFYDVSLLFTSSVEKNDIDTCVVELERNGYVSKKVKGYLSERAIPPGGDKSDANNSLCKITHKGIEYVENLKRYKSTNLKSIIALILSGIAILLTIINYLHSINSTCQ